MSLPLKNNKAFTLAEVLITLGIIGVVAALTIPTLMANNQKTQYVTNLKKAYTEFNQALIKVAADNGCTGDLSCLPEMSGGNTTSTYNFGELLAPYFKMLKNCKNNSNQECMTDNANKKNDGTGTTTNMDNSWQYKFITTDGIAFSITTNGDSCVSSLGTGHMSKQCGTVWIDVNGPKKGPNYWGRDIFYIYITTGNGPLLYPQGGQEHAWLHWDNVGDPSCLTTASSTSSTICTARIIEEGWKMNY